VDLLHFFGSDHKTCTKFLLTLPGNFNYHNLLIEVLPPPPPPTLALPRHHHFGLAVGAKS
jgi:hypothetical protein